MHDAASSQPLQEPGTPGAISLSEIVSLLKRHTLRLLVIGLVAGGLAYAACQVVTPRYTGIATILVENIDPYLPTEGTTQPQGKAIDSSFMNNQVELLATWTLHEKIADRLDLYSDPEFNTSLVPPEERPLLTQAMDWLYIKVDLLKEALLQPEPELAQLEGVDPARLGTIDAVGGALVANVRGGSHVIAIEATSEAPAKAALLANTTAELFLESQVELKNQRLNESEGWVGERIGELRADMEAAEAAVGEQLRQMEFFDGDTKSILNEQLSRISSEILTVREERIREEAKLRRLRSLLQSGGAIENTEETMTSPVIQNLRAQETGLLSQRAELSSRYGQRHPTMMAAESSLRSVRQKIQTEISRIAENQIDKVRVVRDREAQLLAERGGLQDQISAQSEELPALRVLERDAETKRLVYEQFLSQALQVARVEEMQAPDARILAMSIVPRSPAFPQTKLISALAAFAAISIAFLTVLVRESADKGVRSSEHTERLFGLPTLAMIPRVTGKRFRERPEDAITELPRSAASESVRSLFTSLQLIEVDEHQPRTMLITSSVPFEGKTMVSISLARQTALAGYKTVLVNMDLRRDNSRYRKPPERRNVSSHNALIQQGPLLDECLEIEEDTGLVKLVFPSSLRNPAELLNSEQIDGLIQDLSRRYDRVIIDSPPVLVVPDARFLARIADTTIYVVRWAHTPKDKVVEGLRILRMSHARIGGIVLSQFDPRLHSKYSYRDSGMYHGSAGGYYVQ